MTKLAAKGCVVPSRVSSALSVASPSAMSTTVEHMMKLSSTPACSSSKHIIDGSNNVSSASSVDSTRTVHSVLTSSQMGSSHVDPARMSYRHFSFTRRKVNMRQQTIRSTMGQKEDFQSQIDKLHGRQAFIDFFLRNRDDLQVSSTIRILQRIAPMITPENKSDFVQILIGIAKKLDQFSPEDLNIVAALAFQIRDRELLRAVDPFVRQHLASFTIEDLVNIAEFYIEMKCPTRAFLTAVVHQLSSQQWNVQEHHALIARVIHIFSRASYKPRYCIHGMSSLVMEIVRNDIDWDATIRLRNANKATVSEKNQPSSKNMDAKSLPEALISNQETSIFVEREKKGQIPAVAMHVDEIPWSVLGENNVNINGGNSPHEESSGLNGRTGTMAKTISMTKASEATENNPVQKNRLVLKNQSPWTPAELLNIVLAYERWPMEESDRIRGKSFKNNPNTLLRNYAVHYFLQKDSVTATTKDSRYTYLEGDSAPSMGRFLRFLGALTRWDKEWARESTDLLKLIHVFEDLHIRKFKGRESELKVPANHAADRAGEHESGFDDLEGGFVNIDNPDGSNLDGGFDDVDGVECDRRKVGAGNDPESADELLSVERDRCFEATSNSTPSAKELPKDGTSFRPGIQRSNNKLSPRNLAAWSYLYYRLQRQPLRDDLLQNILLPHADLLLGITAPSHLATTLIGLSTMRSAVGHRNIECDVQVTDARMGNNERDSADTLLHDSIGNYFDRAEIRIRKTITDIRQTRDLVRIFHAFAMQNSGSAELFSVLQPKLYKSLQEMSAYEMSLTFSSMARLRLESFVGKFSEQAKVCAQERVGQFGAPEICNILFATSVLRMDNDMQFTKRMLSVLGPSALSKPECALLYPFLKHQSLSFMDVSAGEGGPSEVEKASPEEEQAPASSASSVPNLFSDSADLQRYIGYVQPNYWKMQLEMQNADTDYRFWADDIRNLLTEFEENADLSVDFEENSNVSGFLLDFVVTLSEQGIGKVQNENQTRKIALLFHSTKTTLHRSTMQPLGHALLKHRIVKKLGGGPSSGARQYSIVNIWSQMWFESTKDEQKEFLLEKLNIR